MVSTLRNLPPTGYAASERVPVIHDTPAPLLVPPLALALLACAFFAAHRNVITVLFALGAISLLASKVVGVAGALVFFFLFAAAWILLHPSALAILLQSREWEGPGWGRGGPRWRRKAATMAGWAALAYDTVTVFACVVSEVARRPAAFAVAREWGYYVPAGVAFVGSVGAVGGLWCLVGAGWEMAAQHIERRMEARCPGADSVLPK
ncbi:hypothetical protein CspeluHIS016_0107000 [Cutaneotrichosporon spelunceum]|uniref:Uncharacterized protein n=1 Tax=Cutaneotrichosporon spelunceum TaxID=1672016 RepID=A0AAD3Y9X1_9TREE|nr:hypothetical protein CspeluHIS016_0107000 [Cutaneotrichosporon spelunceum]